MPSLSILMMYLPSVVECHIEGPGLALLRIEPLHFEVRELNLASREDGSGIVRPLIVHKEDADGGIGMELSLTEAMQAEKRILGVVDGDQKGDLGKIGLLPSFARVFLRRCRRRRTLPSAGRISMRTGMMIQAPQKTKELRIPSDYGHS